MQFFKNIKLGKIISGMLFCISLICLFCIHEDMNKEVIWFAFWLTSLSLSGRWLSKYIDEEEKS